MADWSRVRSVFEDALDVPAGERSAWVAEACGEDAELRAEVEALLAREADAEDFLQPPQGDPVEALLGRATFEGRRLGEFEVVRLLGQGGMGTVYLAEQARPRRHVALKLLEGLATGEVRRRFHLEAEILGRLRHPNVAQVYESGSLTIDAIALPYFAMEYVVGARTLLEYAAAEGLDLRQRVALMIDVCAAVQHGHGLGILHRDVKPANVLVGEDGRVKVIDFGIARALGEEDGRTRLTSTGEFVGTLSYMAPERLVDGESASGDVRADVYSLGVVLYELFAGARPFDLRQLPLAEAIRVVVEEEPRPLARAAPELPRDLGWVVQRAIAREPERRYPTAQSLAEDLRRFLAHEPVHAAAPSARYHAAKFVRRHRAGVAAAVTVLATTVLASTGVAVSRAEERNARAQAQAEAVKLLRIRDVLDLQPLRAEALRLAPVPAAVPALEAWLARAAEIEAGLEETRHVLATLDAEEGGSDVDRWLGESLREHAAELEPFFGPGGLNERVEHQLAFARTVLERSVTGAEARAAWSSAAAALADRAACRAYDGLRLAPQLGLLPLGSDPRSGLWEFAHLRSGAPARRGADGELVLTADTGIVLVLLPGGTFTMGSRLPDADHPEGAPNVDPLAFAEDVILGERTLSPFFLSKYELTQAQYERLTGHNPSHHVDPLAPVTRIDWHEASAVATQLALVLPTEAQWEYATRAGTTTPHWCDPPTDWSEVTNLHAEYPLPVGSFPPNPFGLHDMLGNVVEWCRDPPGKRATPFRASDGEWLPEEPGEFRARRGGGTPFAPEYRALMARSAQRLMQRSTQADDRCGVRLSRALDPE